MGRSGTASKRSQSAPEQGPRLVLLLLGNLVSTMVESVTEEQALDAYSTIVTSVAEKVLPSVASLPIGRAGRGFGGAGPGAVITPAGFPATPPPAAPPANPPTPPFPAA